jgi:hypothetical protein
MPEASPLVVTLVSHARPGLHGYRGEWTSRRPRWPPDKVVFMPDGTVA